ncbi:hypothetical protein Dimus_037340, partial [Dionaea muscipula]
RGFQPHSGANVAVSVVAVHDTILDRFAATEARVYPLVRISPPSPFAPPPPPSRTPVSPKARRRVPGSATKAWSARRVFKSGLFFRSHHRRSSAQDLADRFLSLQQRAKQSPFFSEVNA